MVAYYWLRMNANHYLKIDFITNKIHLESTDVVILDSVSQLADDIPVSHPIVIKKLSDAEED